MSVFNFPENQFVRIFNENEKVKISTISINSCEIGNVRMKVFLKGNRSSEKLKLIFCPKGITTSLFESDEVNLSSIAPNFYGLVRFDFQRNNIAQGEYDIYAEVLSYSRNGNTDYVSLVYDFPVAIYDNSEQNFDGHPIALEVFKYI